MRRCWALAAVLAASLGGAGHADVVRLKLGTGGFGQGWRFLDKDGCKVATAGHVVRGLDGQVLPAIVLDRRNREWPVGRALVMSVDPDVAVLAIPSAGDAGACGDGRLSTIGIARRVAEMSNAVIETTGESEVVEVPVKRRASAMDSGGGEVFTVLPLLPVDQLRKGWSGSVVRDGDGPLGLVFEIPRDGGEAYAVRIDVVRRLMEAAAKPAAVVAAGARAPPAIAVEAGATSDLSAGPDMIATEGGWKVVPRGRTVVFTASFQPARQVDHVRLTASPGAANPMENLDVAMQAEGGGNWTPLNYCANAGGAPEVTCRFLASTVVRLRIVVRLRTSLPVTLARFSVE